MAIINPEGLFGGDRLRRCSNIAQLHWPRLYLAANGFGRLELNYAKLLRAYTTFDPVPTELELQSILMEFAGNHLLYVYDADGQVWAQWDTAPENLPRYKTSADRRSPAPPEPAFTEWKSAYRHNCKALPKSFRSLSEAFTKLRGNSSESFHADAHGVGVGVGVGEAEGRRGVGFQEVQPPNAFEDWADAVCLRHPKPKDRTLALHALVKLAAAPDFDSAAFDAVHHAWCETGAWRKENGVFAPTLAAWIGDQGYRKMPLPDMAQGRPATNSNDAWAAELDRETGEVA